MKTIIKLNEICTIESLENCKVNIEIKIYETSTIVNINDLREAIRKMVTK